MKRFPILLSVLLVFAAGLRADEIRLKDGSKITGTIVEFENDSFKVQTAYGFAMVRKDSIAQIVPSDANKSADPAKPVTAAASAATVKPASAIAAAPAVKADSQPAISQGATSSPVAATVVTPARAVPASALAMPAPNPRPTPPAPLAAIPSAEPPPPVAAAPPIPASPLPIRESVQGTVYTNETYGFQLYRPPGWGLMLEARKALPNAITAMGTSDETTLFVVGREAVRDSLEAQAANSERALQKVYENYRHVSTEKRTVGGLPAVQWQFRGLADGHDWSVTVLTIARGGDVFTLLGMTYADSDLIQIRENVIAKMIASLQFGAPR